MPANKRRVKGISPAEVAARKASAALGRLSNAYTEDEIDKVLAPEIQRAIQKERRKFGQTLATAGTTQPGYSTNEIDVHIDPRGNRYDNQLYYLDPTLAIEPVEGDEAYAPANFGSSYTEAPTATSRPDKPRTVAAAYDPNRSTLTVVFRDSTIYNYYDVDMDEWLGFRNAIGSNGVPSKWEYIRNVLDYKPRGVADSSSISPQVRMFAYRATRAAQIQKYGKKK